MNFFFLLIFVSNFFISYGTKIFYVPGTEDIPLIEGAQIPENQATIFDTLEGKVVISRIVSPLSSSNVKKFYAEVLPNLGWKEISSNQYQRGKQFLEVKLESINGKVFISFELKEFS